MRRIVPLLLALLLGAVVPVLAVPESAPDDADHNRRLLDLYRADPDHYARLLRDLRAFQALPADKQERMRQFDRELHDEDPALQNQLWEVLERYTDWVNGLPEDKQKRIEQAADRNERLAIVKALRQTEWIDWLPTKDLADLLALPLAEQPARLAELRQTERQRRREWVDWAAALKARPDAGPNARPPHPGALTEVPQKMLKEFANNELTKQERHNLHLRGLDPAEQYEKLQEEYFKRHPEALQKYHRK